MRAAALLVCCAALLGCSPRPGQVLDEARKAGRSAASLPAATDLAYFGAMDGGADLSPEEASGRNTWLVWTGGNDRMWDRVATTSEGTLDLLKTLSSHPALGEDFRRENRWRSFGLVNDPCFEKASGPGAFGLWLDKRRDGDACREPFEDEKAYPGIALGGRGQTAWKGTTLPVGSYYGFGTGVIGLRLFPNPAFDDEAARDWDPERYYTDGEYAKKVVRPFRVGMSCALCHVGPNPVKPPTDPANPKWENLSSIVGAQYFKVGRVFAWQADEKAFLFQLFATSRPGTLDTSFIPTDGINNPRAMNALYLVGPRLEQGKRWGKERLAGAATHHKQLSGFFEPPATAWAPHVLKDGADSVGALGALNRVYLNIGVFSEEMLLHVNPLLGGMHQSPIDLGIARKNSAYWQATEEQTANVARFLVKVSAPHKLAEALGSRYLRPPQAQLSRGKIMFADNCAHCHSSKIPQGTPLDPGGCAGKDYLACLDRYWQWTRTPAFKEEMRRLVLAEDFLERNFLSTDLRVPVTLLQTNACSPLASNAIADHVWANFSSQSYKNLPPVGAVTVHHPLTGKARRYEMPGGGRGYTRPPSLVSLWSSAPFLLNNTIGRHHDDPSVAARLRAFDDGIGQLLWPERRERDARLGHLGVGSIDRTNERSSLHLSRGFLPGWTRPFLPLLKRFSHLQVSESGVDIGPIPAGIPINLIANVQLHPEESNLLKQGLHYWKVLRLLHAAAQLDEGGGSFPALADRLLDLSKCPDFVVNRGHYFGAGLSDDDKRALIEFLKTF